MTTRSTILHGTMLALAVLAALASMPVARAGGAAGMAYVHDPALGDVAAARGVALPFDETFVPRGGFAVVHLANGRLVKVAADAAVRFEEAAGGVARMTVYSGYASVVSRTGRIARVGGFAVVTLEPRDEDPYRVEEALVRDESEPAATPRRAAAHRLRD